jgi:hypothetical protein
MSLVVTLFVLGMLIVKARDPNTWVWFTGQPKQEVPDDLRPVAAVKAGDHGPAPSGEQEQAAPSGPTDLDPEEQSAAHYQFQAVSDGTLGMGEEEMPAYWRLFKWTKSQSFAEMNRRAAEQLGRQPNREVVFDQFVRQSDEQRGKLFHLDLNVNQIFSYPAPRNSAGIKTVYEIRGYTEQSGVWLYFVLTPELPPGMPTGIHVHERAAFAGYFMKVQGYHPAVAGPKDKPLSAPLFIGRLAWKPAAQPVQTTADLTWLWWLGGVAVLFGAARLGLWVYGRSRPERPAVVSRGKAAELRGWLADVAGESIDANVLDDGEGEVDGNPQGANGSLTSTDFRNN